MIKPWGHWIAVEDPPADKQDGTVGGLYIPAELGYDTLSKGVVVGVGEEVKGPPGFGDGAVVYYKHSCSLELGVKSQIKFIQADHIVCWEEA